MMGGGENYDNMQLQRVKFKDMGLNSKASYTNIKYYTLLMSVLLM